jgi:hypothetical protein
VTPAKTAEPRESLSGAPSFQYPSAAGRDYYGTENYMRLHHRTENYIRLHHHLGDCYLINIDETLFYAD